MKIAVRKMDGQLANGAIKIGAVARHFHVSVDLLRLYEREGLLIPLKSPRGTRYYTQHDFLWIGAILRLVREARLNFAGIRRLLAVLPCWEIRQCGFNRRIGCSVIADASKPCWSNRAACCRLALSFEGARAGCPEPLRSHVAAAAEAENGQSNRRRGMEECYFCAVYRSAPSCENLKALLAATSEAPAPAPQSSFE